MIHWENTEDTEIIAENMNQLFQNDNVTGAYKEGNKYEVGDLCIYYNTLYRCKVAITSSEGFTGNHWEQITLEEIKNSLEDEINAKDILRLKNTLLTLSSDWNNLETGIYCYNTYVGTNANKGTIEKNKVGMLINVNSSNLKVQFANSGTGDLYSRYYSNDRQTWTDWVKK